MATSQHDDNCKDVNHKIRSSNKPMKSAMRQGPTELLPLELWLNIFCHLQTADLQVLTLTCPPFRWLAQPLMFVVIDVSPFFLAYNVDRRILRPRKYLDRTVERLKFYRSPHIASAVKHCWISPYSRYGFPPRNVRDYLDPDLVINEVIKALPFFPNLRILSWHCINFSTKWWDTVQRLPIRTLWINSCTVDGARPLPLPIRHLDLDQWAWGGEVTNHPSIHEEHSLGVSQVSISLVLHPEQIQHISVPRTDTCMRLLSTMVMMDRFTSLRVLRIPFLVLPSPELTEALVNCPVLQELRIFAPADSINEEHREIKVPHLPPSSLPLLSIYEGPYTLLLTFCEGRPIKDILIWGLDELPGLCNPSLLANTLRQFSSFNTTLEAFHISISYITVELLTTITSFPLLKSLEVTSGDSPRATGSFQGHQRSTDTTVNLLYITLRNIQLPPRIENLRMSTKLNHGNLDTPTQQQEALQFIESIALAHPRLQDVEIGYGTYWTGTYIARWKRNVIRSDDAHPASLGSLVFKEHRRTIVFPDVQGMSETDQWSGSKGANWRIVMWARRLLREYF
ncbi:hypothetical protein DXG01_001043 [Tephrocybe rancida]|nr:hypothetical protein DXG01_001043 [Tephrocybe rancida]